VAQNVTFLVHTYKNGTIPGARAPSRSLRVRATLGGVGRALTLLCIATRVAIQLPASKISGGHRRVVARPCPRSDGEEEAGSFAPCLRSGRVGALRAAGLAGVLRQLGRPVKADARIRGWPEVGLHASVWVGVHGTAVRAPARLTGLRWARAASQCAWHVARVVARAPCACGRARSACEQLPKFLRRSPFLAHAADAGHIADWRVQVLANLCSDLGAVLRTATTGARWLLCARRAHAGLRVQVFVGRAKREY